MNSYLFINYLIKNVPKYIKTITVRKNELTIETDLNDISFLIDFFKNHYKFKFKCLSCLTVVDYPNKLNRFELNYFLLSYILNQRIIIKIETDDLKPVNSIVDIFPSAN
jgi:NADH-quinone oxidoreductase subunit C